MKRFAFTLATVIGLACAAPAAEPKRLLVVGATASFRHPSIENGEKTIRQLAQKSDGQFTAIFMSESPDYPKYPAPGARGGGGGARGGVPAFPGQVAEWALGLVDADNKP